MSDYDSIPFESQNVIDTVFNLDDRPMLATNTFQ